MRIRRTFGFQVSSFKLQVSSFKFQISSSEFQISSFKFQISKESIMERIERREYKRMFFSIEDGPVAVFDLPNYQEKTIRAIVMDLSPGGMGLSIKKDDNIIINVEDRLLLREFKGHTELWPVVGIETKIRWIQNYKGFKHMLFGCEFLDIPETAKDQIRNFINSWADKMTRR
ncbi:PilZ domain-containing protein [Desulfonema magnum]|uniref:PilZ domain-containing protein n=2 Tax=Desulfonema magnum TaxID=45655 RepID=A0A975GQ00_9BACT|nr:PilZ domain-containing protein [Desulfonema magnum]